MGTLRFAVFALFLASTVADAKGKLADDPRFKDQLPIPPRILVPAGKPTRVDIPMTQFKMKLYKELPETTVWGYAGSSPGPTIEVESGTALTVHWQNKLPSRHFLKASGPDMPHMPHPELPDVRTVVHLHGAVVSQPSTFDKTRNNDGWPDAWIEPGQEQIAEYPNEQTARTLWYHDHAMETTGRNVYAGLVGLYLIRDAYERSLNLPSGDYEIPLIFQARGLNGDGSLFYPERTGTDYFGDKVAVNGKIWPYLKVEPRKYRFRMVNASNSRALSLRLINPDDDSHGPAFYVIGSDAGFLAETTVLNDPDDPQGRRLSLASAERADVIIDFSRWAGKTLLLHNNSFTEEDDGEVPVPHIMIFKVGTRVHGVDRSSIPTKMKPIVKLNPASSAQRRNIVLTHELMPDGTDMLLLNGMYWTDPITEFPVLGTTETWSIVNAMPEAHPFHIHLVQFQVLDRTPYDAEHYQDSGEILLTGPPEVPPPEEQGWKDTVLSPVGVITRIIMRFEPFAGYYVYHCHILEHEDMDMMRPFQVIDAPR